MRRTRRAVTLAVVGSAALMAVPALARPAAARPHGPETATPIRHLVVIFQENVSFDHYFGTYPNATNTSGPTFTAKAGTPTVNGLTNTLLTANPNGANPRRYDPGKVSDLLTCDQNHAYTAEQKAFDNGLMDKFPATVGTGSGTSNTGQACNANDVMNYYDGNAVTGLWNYAQNFAMSDNSFGTTFGPSSPGAINLVSGDTGGVDTAHEANSPSIATSAAPNADLVSDGHGGYTLISDAQPYYDDCSTRDAVGLLGSNVGDALNAAGLSWGWFQGGFAPTTPFTSAAALVDPGQPTSTFTPDEFKGAFTGKVVPTGASNQALCDAVHPVGAALGGTGGTAGSGGTSYGYKDDYIPHHEPFQYYATTANPHHLAPASLAAIGTDTQSFVHGAPQFDTANHQYDTSDFDSLVKAIGNGTLSPDHLPAVSFLKAPGYQDGHAGYSDPIDEQNFIVNEINALEQLPTWSSTAVVIAYDDSDGWYDHAFSGVRNPSMTVSDALTAAAQCGTVGDDQRQPLGGDQGRCGYGPRMPLLVISPWAKSNYVDHHITDQSSILRFVEDNWGLDRIPGSFDRLAGTLNRMFNFEGEHLAAPLYLNPMTGQVSP